MLPIQPFSNSMWGAEIVAFLSIFATITVIKMVLIRTTHSSHRLDVGAAGLQTWATVIQQSTEYTYVCRGWSTFIFFKHFVKLFRQHDTLTRNGHGHFRTVHVLFDCKCICWSPSQHYGCSTVSNHLSYEKRLAQTILFYFILFKFRPANRYIL